MESNLIQQENNFTGGSDRDTSLQYVKIDAYFEGNDICISSAKESTGYSVSPNDGNTQVFGLGVVNATRSQVFKFDLDTSISFGAGVIHTVQVLSASGVSHTFRVESNLGTQILRYEDLISAIVTGPDLDGNPTLHALYPTIAFSSAQNSTLNYFTLEFKNALEDFDIFVTKNGATEQLIALTERITASEFGAFKGVETIQLENDLFILSTNNRVSQVSVAKKNEVTGVWTVTSLAKTKKLFISKSFGVVTQLKGELINNMVRLYWVDGNDVPRCFYVVKQNVWQTNYAIRWTLDNTQTLAVENQDGFYTYNSIEKSTRLQIFNNSVYCSDVNVINGKGFFTSGNKRFAIRMKSQNTFTGFGVLSDPIPVPIRNLASVVGGGGKDSSDTNIIATGIQTNKSITLEISGIDNTEFSDFEVGVVEYIGGSISAFVLGSFPVQNGKFSITLQGNENKRDLSIVEFQEFQPAIKTAHLNEIDQNKYFIGRVELQQHPDVSAWVQGTVFNPANIEIKTKTLPAVGINLGNANNEYYNPHNVYKYTGFMYNETYRLGLKINWTNGLQTTYFGRDIGIRNSTGGVLTDGGIGTNLTPQNVNVFYINFKKIDFTTAPNVNGKKMVDLVESIQIVRCECIPEVLCSGYALLGYLALNGTDSIGNLVPFDTLGVTLSFPPMKRNVAPAPPGTPLTLAYWFYDVGDANILRGYGNFVSQDISCGLSNPIFTGTEFFIDFGEPRPYNRVFDDDITTPDLAFFSEYTGAFVAAGAPTHTIESMTPIKWGTIASIDGGSGYINKISALSPTNYHYFYNNINPGYRVNGSATVSSDGMAFRITDWFSKTSLIEESGAHYTQLCRTIANKYGDPKNNTYLSFGTFIKIGGTNGFTFTDVEMFSGDTFTQKSYHKMVYNCTAQWAFTPTPDNILESGVSYYSQNRINSQYRNAAGNDKATVPLAYTLNTTSLLDWLTGAASKLTSEPFHFDLGYLPTDQVRNTRVFDFTVKQIVQQFSSLYNSDDNLESDLTDNYRLIRAGNIKTYETSDGYLTGINRFNNNLVIHQNTMVSIQPISPNVILSSQDITALILGTGTVLGAQITPLSRVGTTLKSSIRRYIKRNGKEEISWYANNKFQILSLGQEGVKTLSTEHKYDNFLISNNDFIVNENDYYINYDPYYNTTFFIANAVANSTLSAGTTLWNNFTAYVKSQRVYINPNFQFPLIYKAKRDVPLNKDPQDDDNFFQYWEYDRNSNYNLAFSFDKKPDGTYVGFIGFMSFMPYLIATYKETFLSMISFNSNPQNSFFFSEHHINPDCNYYNGQIIGKPYVISVINKSPKKFKDFMKAFFDTDLPPIRIELFNPIEDTKTYIKAPDIKKYRNLYRATTKRDATISVINPNGLNNVEGTKQMRGEIFKIKIFLQKQMNLRTMFLTLLDKFRKFNN